MLQIKSWISNEVIFEYEGLLKEAVEEAVRQGISLAYADLKGATLEGAYLENADLKNANLINANLRGADLSDACLYGADLFNADLHKANLKGADLRDASLKYADLRGANLIDADLRVANLKHADLNSANLKGVCLYAADLRFAKNIPNNFIPLACPAEGSFIAWKKVDNKLVKLEIPEDAKRCSATSKKCRCSKAKVLAITNLFETKTYDEVVNGNYAPLTYKVGEMVYPDSFDEDRWNECSHGIHFFMDKEEAINW